MGRKKESAETLSHEALLCLMDIVRSEKERAADRIAAAKLILECAAAQGSEEAGGVLKIVFEGVPEEYCV